MAVTVVGKVVQSSDGTVLTFVDETTGIGTLISRTLNVYDSNGNLVQVTNMGASLTAPFDISSDGYWSFVEVIVDNTGSYTGTVNYLSTAFYEIQFAPAIADLDTPCMDIFASWFNLFRADLNEESAEIFAQRAVGQNAQALITAANFYVSTPYYAT